MGHRPQEGHTPHHMAEGGSRATLVSLVCSEGINAKEAAVERWSEPG